MAWTDDRVEILKKMWGEGKSASQIAKELGGVTRNAVIGKVHRLGLSNRATTTKASTKKEPSKIKSTPTTVPVISTTESKITTPKATNIPPRKPIIKAGQPLPPQPSANEISAEALEKVAKIEKKAKKLSLMELTERTCKWPVGDPATEDFLVLWIEC